jgi:hypothetical protein
MILDIVGDRMNRRSFLKTLVGGVAGAAAVRTWPFRVFSFPSEVVIPKYGTYVDEAVLLDDYALDAFRYITGYQPRQGYRTFQADLFTNPWKTLTPPMRVFKA